MPAWSSRKNARKRFRLSCDEGGDKKLRYSDDNGEEDGSENDKLGCDGSEGNATKENEFENE